MSWTWLVGVVVACFAAGILVALAMLWTNDPSESAAESLRSHATHDRHASAPNTTVAPNMTVAPAAPPYGQVARAALPSRASDEARPSVSPLIPRTPPGVPEPGVPETAPGTDG